MYCSLLSWKTCSCRVLETNRAICNSNPCWRRPPFETAVRVCSEKKPHSILATLPWGNLPASASYLSPLPLIGHKWRETGYHTIVRKYKLSQSVTSALRSLRWVYLESNAATNFSQNYHREQTGTNNRTRQIIQGMLL